MKNGLPKHRNFLVVSFLVVATFAVYWQVHDHEFISYDDGDYVTSNPHVREGLTLAAVKWAFTSGYIANYHPLTWLSHMLDIELSGFSSGFHHLSSVFIHVLNTLLLFVVLRQMTGGFWQSAFVASMFALHPLHVESAAWVSERKDVLSTLFWMLTLWAYFRYVQEPNLGRYSLILLSLALGLLAKQMLVTLPFVFLLLDFWPLGRLQVGQVTGANKAQVEFRGGIKGQNAAVLQLVREKVPLLAVALFFSVLVYVVQQSGGAMSSSDLLPLSARISNALVSYLRYIGKTIWPANLAIFYPHPGQTFQLWQVAGAGVVLIFGSAAVVWNARRLPYLAVGWFWYLGTLVPVIGLVQVGIQAMADRYTYIPIIGLFVMIAWGLPDLLRRWRNRRTVLSGAFLASLATCMILTFAQLKNWKNNVTLFQHALDVTGDNFLAHNDLGSALEKQGKVEEAIAHYREAIRLKPDFVIALSNLGAVVGKRGNLDEAIPLLTKAVQINPKYVDAHNNLGIALSIQGKRTEAIQHFREAIRIKPEHVDAHYNLGLVLEQQGEMKEAIQHYSEVLQIKPDHREARLAVERLLKIQKSE